MEKFLLYNPNNPVDSQKTTATSGAICMNNETIFGNQYDQT